MPTYGGITVRDGGPGGTILSSITYRVEVDACEPTVSFTMDGTQGPFAATVTGSGVLESETSTNSDYIGTIRITDIGQVTIHFTDKNKGQPGEVTFKVAELTPPTVTSLHPLSTTYCEGETITFHGEVLGKKKNNTHYIWEVNGVDMNVDEQDFTTSTLKANDVVKFTALNYGACDIMTDSKTYTVPTLKASVTPVVTVAPSQNPVCGDAKITFKASTNITDPALTYQWFVNDDDAQINSNVFKDYDFKDGYTVRCIVGNLNKCVIPTVSNTVTIKRSDFPIVKFKGDLTMPFGSQLQLAPIITGDIATYSWLPAEGLNDTGIANPVASPQGTTKYTLTVTNTGGCQSQASILVKVTIAIPNTFTPNGDGVNDTWKIAALSNNPNYTLNVYNRYGSKVFESVGYTKDWDGTFDGKNLPPGTYYYLIHDKAAGDNIAGNITIIR